LLAVVVYVLCVSVAALQVLIAWISENFNFFESIFWFENWHVSLQIGGGGCFVFLGILFLIGGFDDAK